MGTRTTSFPVLFLTLFFFSSTERQAAADDEVPPAERGAFALAGFFRIFVDLEARTVSTKTLMRSTEPEATSTRVFARIAGRGHTAESPLLIVTVENRRATDLVGPVGLIVTRIDARTVSVRNADEGTGPGSWRFDYADALLGGDNRLAPGERSSSRRWRFRASYVQSFSVDVQVVAGLPLAAGEGATIVGAGDTAVTVTPDSIPYEVLIDVAPVPVESLEADAGDMTVAGAVEVTYRPTPLGGSLSPPDAPLLLSIPAPPGTPDGTRFVIAQQVLSDFVHDDEAELRQQFLAVAMAQSVGGRLESTTSVLPGAFGGGFYAFLAASGSGFVTGNVSDGTAPRRGAVVSNDTNTLIAVSDAAGAYSLFISGGPFTVEAFDPLRGSFGTETGNIGTDGATVRADIRVFDLPIPPITRDGIRNSGFERGNLTGWAASGAASALQRLECTGTTIQPSEGQWMADINTGPGSIGDTGSALTQRFAVPAGVRALTFDFNFVSEEFPEFVGSAFNDRFLALITTPGGQSTIQEISVNASGGFSEIGDCRFPDGDTTAGMTGWRSAAVDVSAFAGTGTTIQVDLLFSANDAGDDIFDTHVLIDNLRFSTLWIDAKILDGPFVKPNADTLRVAREVREANEILSQAGMNVRIRRVIVTPTTDALVDTDITWTTGPACADGRLNGRLTAESRSVVGLARSAFNTDLNVYYVRSGTGASAGGWAIGPDDFCVDVDILTNSGTLQMDSGTGGEILAHEIGHITVSPQNFADALEHNAAAGNFLSTVAATPPLGVLTRQQSANINRVNAPLLQP